MKVKDLFTFGGLTEGKLIAGKRGTDRVVESVSVLEVTEPTDGRWFLKNQISVTAFYAIKDDVEAQKNLIIEFNKSGGAGIIICHIDFWLKNIDASIIKLCDDIDFPLIVVPSDISYIDIIIPINEKLLKIHSDKYKYFLDLQSELIGLIIENRDINDIAKYIFRISSRGTAILDINSKILSSEGINEESIEFIINYCKNNFNIIHEKYENLDTLIIKSNVGKFMIQPIIINKDCFGFIAIEEVRKSPLNKKDPKLIMKYTSIAIALIITKKQRIEKMQDIYFRDYLADLLTWNFVNEETAIMRGKSIGWDIENKRLLILINLNSVFLKEIDNPYDDNIGDYTNKFLLPIIENIAENDNSKNLVGFRSDNIIVLLHTKGNNEDIYKRAKKITEAILSKNKEKQKIALSIGVSNYFETIPEISNAYKEALAAMRIGRSIKGQGLAFTYIELGYIPYFKDDKLLLKYENVRDYFLVPLLEYDRIHNTQLVETLRNLLFSDLNIVEVSNKMFIHRNTILARKKRILDLLEHNPFEMPYKLNYLMLFSVEDK